MDFFVHWPPLFFPDPSLFSSPTPLTVQSSPSSQLKFYQFFWGCSQYPADQQGTLQQQAAFETLAEHQPSHHYTYRLTELELVLQMTGLCGKRLFRPRKGRELSSHLSFRSTTKAFLWLVAVWEANPSKSVFGNSSFWSLERRKGITLSKCPSSYLFYVCEWTIVLWSHKECSTLQVNWWAHFKQF